MGDAEDPDPGGWHVHPAAAFYGLWPRVAGTNDAEAEDSSEAAGAPD